MKNNMMKNNITSNVILVDGGSSLTFRPLKMGEIRCKVQSCGKTAGGKPYAILTLYTDARVVMSILDETVNPVGWQRRHEEIKGNIYCSIGIYSLQLKEWVYKSDCGTESFSEKEKGEASDSFKRAGVNWGIARELHSAPNIFVSLKDDEFYEVEEKGKMRVKLKSEVKFRVAYVKTDRIQGQNTITALAIKDKKDNDRFTFLADTAPDIDLNEQIRSVRIYDYIAQLGITEEAAAAQYGKEKISDLTTAEKENAIKRMEKRIKELDI